MKALSFPNRDPGKVIPLSPAEITAQEFHPDVKM